MHQKNKHLKAKINQIVATDKVFAKKQKQIAPFAFNEKVANVFDDMVNRSIPFYNEIHSLILDIVDNYLPSKSIVYDLGCSTGSTLQLIDSLITKKMNHAKLIGIDNSHAMLKKAEEKLKNTNNEIILTEDDICSFNIKNADLVVMNYTLQFIPPQKRKLLLQRIYNGVKKGGFLILSEKIASDAKEFQQMTTKLYHDFKRRNGYSELEISQKREALEKVLIPSTPGKNLELLKTAGFKNSEMIFRWYNFACFVAKK